MKQIQLGLFFDREIHHYTILYAASEVSLRAAAAAAAAAVGTAPRASLRAPSFVPLHDVYRRSIIDRASESSSWLAFGWRGRCRGRKDEGFAILQLRFR